MVENSPQKMLKSIRDMHFSHLLESPLISFLMLKTPMSISYPNFALTQRLLTLQPVHVPIFCDNKRVIGRA